MITILNNIQLTIQFPKFGYTQTIQFGNGHADSFIDEHKYVIGFMFSTEQQTLFYNSILALAENTFIKYLLQEAVVKLKQK